MISNTIHGNFKIEHAPCKQPARYILHGLIQEYSFVSKVPNGNESEA